MFIKPFWSKKYIYIASSFLLSSTKFLGYILDMCILVTAQPLNLLTNIVELPYFMILVRDGAFLTRVAENVSYSLLYLPLLLAWGHMTQAPLTWHSYSKDIVIASHFQDSFHSFMETESLGQ